MLEMRMARAFYYRLITFEYVTRNMRLKRDEIFIGEHFPANFKSFRIFYNAKSTSIRCWRIKMDTLHEKKVSGIFCFTARYFSSQ